MQGTDTSCSGVPVTGLSILDLYLFGCLGVPGELRTSSKDGAALCPEGRLLSVSRRRDGGRLRGMTIQGIDGGGE